MNKDRNFSALFKYFNDKENIHDTRTFSKEAA